MPRRPRSRTQPVEPSLFLREIDKDCIRIIGDAPYGFAGQSGGRLNYKNRSALAAQQETKSKVSSDGRWKVGDTLFHDDYGYGGVFDIREDDEDGPVISVRFNGGREVRFLSIYQSSNFMKTDYTG